MFCRRVAHVHAAVVPCPLAEPAELRSFTPNHKVGPLVGLFLTRLPMIIVNLHEAKAKLSEYAAAVERGEAVLLARRNVPVAVRW